MRKRYKKSNHYPVVLALIGEHYYDIREKCFHVRRSNYSKERFEDIFSETILFIVSDAESIKCSTLDVFTRHFTYRFTMIEFQTLKDQQQLKEIPYADYLQAKKETE